MGSRFLLSVSDVKRGEKMINREIVYERNLTGSFMKIAAGIHAGLDEKLMLRRKLPGLLAVEKAYMDGDRQSILPGQWRQTGTDLFWYFQMPVKTECGRFNGENGSQTRMLLDRTPTQRHRMESDSHQIMWTKTTMCILPLD